VLLNLLHGTLSVERVKDNLVGVETGLMRDRLAGVLGRPRELKGLGTVEGGGSADLARLMRACTLQDCLGSSASPVAGLGLACSVQKLSVSLVIDTEPKI
jgi:hypothetical protein